MSNFISKWQSTKVIELGSAAFRQWRATSHCNKLHGYLLTAKFWVAGTDLDDRNWIYDFGGFKQIRESLQRTFDHKTIVAGNDPHLDTFYKLQDQGIIDLMVLPNVGVERFAEYAFKLADKFIRENTNNRCWVEKVEVFEHDKNSATYSQAPHYSADTLANICVSETEQPKITKAIPKPIFPPNTLQSEGQIKITDAPIQPIDKNAAPVGQKSTPGLGGLFSGTMLG